MNTMRHAFFSTTHSQVCVRCGARYGRCEHTEAPEPPTPAAWEAGKQPARPFAKFKNPWTPQEDAILTELWLGGETQGYIAKCLKRPHGSVASRILRLGLRGER